VHQNLLSSTRITPAEITMAATPTPTKLNLFEYEGKQYIKVIPSKTLLRSTTLFEIVTRGDTLALELDTGILRVIPTSKQHTIVLREMEVAL
jgi:hypothetical protein